MIVKFSHLLLAATIIHFSSSAILRNAIVKDVQQQDRLSLRGRRHLLKEYTCTLFQKCVTYDASEEHPNGHHQDSWVCKLSKDDSLSLNTLFVDIVGATITNATSGKSVLTVSEGSIDAEKSILYISDGADVIVGNLRTQHRHHSMVTNDMIANDMNANDIITNFQGKDAEEVPKTGTLPTLVVRILDRNNRAPRMSHDKLKNDVFNDGASLKTQTEACSYGKLKIQPFSGYTPSNRKYINGGVVDVYTDYNVGGDARNIDQVALMAANSQLGDLGDSRFGLVMFCLPPGSTNYIGFAYPNMKYSFYNDQVCGQVASQMHEVGHNLGLGHSGAFDSSMNYEEYGDGVGMMADSPAVDDMRRCFNPQKNYQLGWYADRVATINPLDNIGRLEFKLNGVSDYRRSQDALVVLRLQQISKEQDFYIGYNRAWGINQDTGEDPNMITIVRKEYGMPDQYSQSTKVASLKAGERFMISNFNGSNNAVQIAVLSINGADARIEVTAECKKFPVELKTDQFPGEITVEVTDRSGEMAPIQWKFDQKYHLYKQDLCLPMGPTAKTYTFSVIDGYGDGITSQGYYKVSNEWGNQLFSYSGGDFRTKEHTLEVPRTTSPLVRPSLQQHDTADEPDPSTPCRDHLIEFKTDGYPHDNSWTIVRMRKGVSMGQEKVVFKSTEYKEQSTVYTTEVCLHEGFDYSFRFLDVYQDGICCGSNDVSKGRYRVINQCNGRVLVDSGMKDEEFREKFHTISVGESTGGCNAEALNATPKKTRKPRTPKKPGNISNCKNEVVNKFRAFLDGPSGTCKQYAKENKCNSTITAGNTKKGNFEGKFIWQVCQKSCNKCKKKKKKKKMKQRNRARNKIELN